MLEIIKYDENVHKSIWDNFVKSSNNGTIFHLREFLNYHQSRQFNDCSFIFKEKDKIQGLFSGAVVNNILHSHPGASFGGFVHNDLSFEISNQMIDMLITEAQNKKLNEIVIIPTPFVYYQNYHEVIEYCLYNKGFKDIEYYISSFVDLDNNLIEQMHSRKKRYIKKFENQVKVKLSEDLDSFYPILIENKKKHNATPTHSLDELKLLINKFPDQIKLLLTFKDDKVIGGALNFITNNHTCILFYNMIDYDYQNMQIASIQIYESLKWAKKINLRFFDIGVSQIYDNDLIIPHASLINFKEQFGSKTMIRKVMKLKL